LVVDRVVVDMVECQVRKDVCRILSSRVGYGRRVIDMDVEVEIEAEIQVLSSCVVLLKGCSTKC
jgi:hypothetical protein